MLGLQDFSVSVRWNVNRWSEKDYGPGKRRGKQEVVPSFLESFSAADADVEDEDRATGFSGEHDWAGFGDVTRAARAINREGAIDAFFQATSHHCKSAKAAA